MVEASTRVKLAHLQDQFEMIREQDPRQYAAMVAGARLVISTLREALDVYETMFDKIDSK